MKKLFIVALLAASVVGMAEARCRDNSCAPRKSCEPCVKTCIRPACVVDCVTNTCIGDKPQLCALEPARVDLIEHTDINKYYTCAPLKPCQVKATDEQVNQLIAEGSLPAETRACP